MCLHLLPNGKKQRNEWFAGSVQGESGQSLHVTLSGKKAGFWNDHADDVQGSNTLLGLWAETRCAGNFVDAIREAKDWLGVKDEGNFVTPAIQKTYQRPRKDKAKALATRSKVEQYLIEDRGVNRDVLSVLKISETKDGEAIVFPYFDGEDCCLIKYLAVDRPEGKKRMWAEPGGKPVLFGKPAIPESTNYVVLCEGEIDAASWHCHGIFAVSIPNGVDNMDWIEHDWDWLERFEKIYISFDMDGPGKKAALEVTERLGRERCYLVDLPEKDFNAVHLAGEEYAQGYLERARMIVPEEIGTFFDEEEEIWKNLNPEQGRIGTPTPWKLKWSIRPGEVTVVTGYNNHGKSPALLQLGLHLTAEGWRGLVVSLEVTPSDSKAQLIRMACNNQVPSRIQFDHLKETKLADMLFYKVQGRVKWKQILSHYKFCIRRYNVNFLVIDSFMLCGVSGKDLDAHNEFMSAMQNMARDTGTHIFVVAHARKPEAENGEWKSPTKHSIKGSGDLTDLAANVICVHANMRKRAEIDKAEREKNVQKLTELSFHKDGDIWVLKQKNGYGEERYWTGGTPIYVNRLTGLSRSKDKDLPNYYEVL